MDIHVASQDSNVQEELERDSLNFSSEDFNFDQIDADLASFQGDEMVQQALSRGIDLKKYGRELDKELKAAEMESVTQYVENNQQVMDLHKQMQECDSVLARMQDMLLGFQGDLGGISEEIKHLQDESLSMSIRLKNRREAEEKLHKFIQNASLTVEAAERIHSNEVSEGFINAVSSLQEKLEYLNQDIPAADGSSLDMLPSETFTGNILVSQLEKMKIRCLSKTKDYFSQQFNALRKPKTNVQVVQQTLLLKYAPLLQFVQSEAPAIGEELRAMYVESMGRTLLSLFKSYTAQLMKLDLVVATRNDLIAVEEAVLKNVFSNKVNLEKRLDSFSLGERGRILDQVEAEPILLHVATAEAQKHPFEALLRSIIKHLSDAATNEFLFILDFFKSNTRDTFNKIFGRTLSLILEHLENYLVNCFDAVGLLIMIKVTHLQRMVMQRRRIPILDSFFDRISMLLWPRLKAVLDSNLKSVKGASVKKLGAIDLTPHYVSRRYAELVSSILTLQTGSDSLGVGGGGESMLAQDLGILRTEMIALMDRMSGTFTSAKDQKVFFINNYDQILGVFQERRIINEETQKFEDLLMQQRALFAEEEIKSSFPRLVSFVVQTEQAVQGSSGTLSLDEVIVESLVREFASNWRSGIQSINDNVLAYFANFRNGMEILKQTLTQLLMYYTRFQDVIKKSWSRPPAFSRDIVSTATILMEIKRYSRTF
jgi:hypothetical protein